MPDNVLVFGAVEAEVEERTRSLDFEVAKRSAAREIPITTLKGNLQGFLDSLNEIIPEAKGNTGFELREFTVQVGIDASGKVGFLGTGAEVGANASLSLKFQKSR